MSMGITVAFWWGTRPTFKYCACYWRSRDGKGRRNVATSSKSRGENESASRHQTIDRPPEQTLTLVKVVIFSLGCVLLRQQRRASARYVQNVWCALFTESGGVGWMNHQWFMMNQWNLLADAQLRRDDPRSVWVAPTGRQIDRPVAESHWRSS